MRRQFPQFLIGRRVRAQGVLQAIIGSSTRRSPRERAFGTLQRGKTGVTVYPRQVTLFHPTSDAHRPRKQFRAHASTAQR
jgi:hypothetical protein